MHIDQGAFLEWISFHIAYMVCLNSSIVKFLDMCFPCYTQNSLPAPNANESSNITITLAEMASVPGANQRSLTK